MLAERKNTSFTHQIHMKILANEHAEQRGKFIPLNYIVLRAFPQTNHRKAKGR